MCQVIFRYRVVAHSRDGFRRDRGYADVQSRRRHVHECADSDDQFNDERSDDSVHDGRQYADKHDRHGLFLCDHDRINDDAEGNRVQERVYEQCGGERYLHDQFADGGDAHVQSCRRHVRECADDDD